MAVSLYCSWVRAVVCLAFCFAASVVFAAQSIELQQLQKEITINHDAGLPLKAVPLAEKYARIIKQQFGPHHQKYSGALYNLGVLYFKAGKNKEANSYFRQSLKVMGLSGPVPPKVLPQLIF